MKIKISLESLSHPFLLFLFLIPSVSFAAPTQRYDNIVLQTQTILHETDESFVFCLSPNFSSPDRNLYLVKKNRTGNGKTEFHALSADSNYQDFSMHLSINLPQTDKTYDFCLAPNLDLYVIKKTNTFTGRIEFFVLSKKSNYIAVSPETKTILMKRDKYTSDKIAFCLASNLDLFAIRKSGSGSTALYVLSGAQKQPNHLREESHEGWKEIRNLNGPNKQLTDGIAVKVSQTASLDDSGASVNSFLKAKNEGKPSHTDQCFELLNDGGQALVIKKEEPESEPEDSTYVQFLMNMN